MIIGFRCDKRGHNFAILLQSNGRWQAVIDGDGVGSYHRPEAALSDMVGGHTSTPSSGIDSGDFDLPDSLRDWNVVTKKQSSL
ncbi:hypothetical protein [Sphingosinicella xenopeptidilytica]|uniref:hypothetical protein n=1 Tax=Sphingosinicella xenopeptidilytica TaxID=364098 RepID=UPI0036D25302